MLLVSLVSIVGGGRVEGGRNGLGLVSLVSWGRLGKRCGSGLVGTRYPKSDGARSGVVSDHLSELGPPAIMLRGRAQRANFLRARKLAETPGPITAKKPRQV